jgi:sterol desaturase/sphingolipid hydroxylase (fatty acid hydroxylase superfamily)
MNDLLAILPLVFIPAFILLGLLYQAREYEQPEWWKTRMSVATVLAVGGAIAIATFWSHLFGDFHLIDGSGLGTWWGAAVGILVYEFIHYWYHRGVHHFDWTWRVAHQMHHSAESMDAFSANYLHPVDLMMFTTWSSLVFFPLLGLNLTAGLLAGVWIGFNTMFQHANINTPSWLGYFIQRPESHVLHHARGQHRYNYANLPLWDMAFGTFRNPKTVQGMKAGFYKGASARVLQMLLGRNMSGPQAASDANVDVVDEGGTVFMKIN